jgi:hypothetical protein
MALKKEFTNNTRNTYKNAYHKPLNISININREEVIVQVGVYAHEEARNALKKGLPTDVVDQYKEVFTFKEFGLTKKKLIDSAYKCLKNTSLKDAEDI